MESNVKKITISITFLITSFMSLFSQTNVSIETAGQIVTIDFQYTKPEGVSELYVNERRALVIDEIKTVQGKKIKGNYKFFWFGSDEGYASGNVDCSENQFTTSLATKWLVSLKNGKYFLCYSSLIRRHPTEFLISDDISCVTVFYHIIFPDGTCSEQYEQELCLNWICDSVVFKRNLEITVYGLGSFNSREIKQIIYSDTFEDSVSVTELQGKISSFFDLFPEEQKSELSEYIPEILSRLNTVNELTKETYIPIYTNTKGVWFTIHVW